MNEEEKVIGTPTEPNVNAQPQQPNAQPQQPNVQPQYVYTQNMPHKNSDIGAEISSTFSTLLGVIKAPADFIPKYVAKASWITSLIITGVYALISIIFGLIRLATTSVSMSSTFEDLANMVSGYMSGGTGFGTYVLRFFNELFSVAATVAVIAALVMLFAQVFGKTKISFFESLSIATLYATIMIPTVIIEFLFGLASPAFASIFTALGSTIGIVFVTMASADKIKNNNMLPYAIGITFAGVKLATWIVGLIF